MGARRETAWQVGDYRVGVRASALGKVGVVSAHSDRLPHSVSESYVAISPLAARASTIHLHRAAMDSGDDELVCDGDDGPEDLGGSDNEHVSSTASTLGQDRTPSARTPSSRKDHGKTSGRPSKLVAGKKKCSTRLKMKPLEEFALNSGHSTTPCRRALDNIRTASAKQGQSAWYTEQVSNQVPRLKLVDAY